MIRRRAALLLAAAASVAGFAPTPQLPAAARVHADKPRQSVVMMPIGVPKVAYRVPGAPSADWIDIYNRLYRERIIFLGQEIDDELANQIIGVMLYLDSEDSTKPIYLYINCPGGSVIAGMAIYDTMQHIKSKVVTINLGLAASMGRRCRSCYRGGSRSSTQSYCSRTSWGGPRSSRFGARR